MGSKYVLLSNSERTFLFYLWMCEHHNRKKRRVFGLGRQKIWGFFLQMFDCDLFHDEQQLYLTLINSFSLDDSFDWLQILIKKAEKYFFSSNFNGSHEICRRNMFLWSFHFFRILSVHRIILHNSILTVIN